ADVERGLRPRVLRRALRQGHGDRAAGGAAVESRAAGARARTRALRRVEGAGRVAQRHAGVAARAGTVGERRLGGADTMTRFHDATVRELCDLLAEETPAPAGGTAAAVGVELAASLVAMAASFSRSQWDDADAVAGRARALRARVAPLAEADADVFGTVL